MLLFGAAASRARERHVLDLGGPLTGTCFFVPNKPLPRAFGSQIPESSSGDNDTRGLVGDMLARPESPKRVELARAGHGTPGWERDLFYQNIPK